MPAPDDFTVTLLHRIQDQRTTPQGGWLGLEDLRSLMSLSPAEAFKHLAAPLQELHSAGMIERHFNAATARDEWRSRGVKPDMGPTRAEAAAEAAEQAMWQDDRARPVSTPPLDPPADTREVLLYLMSGTFERGGWITMPDLIHNLHLPSEGYARAIVGTLEQAGLVELRLNAGRAVRLHRALMDRLP